MSTRSLQIVIVAVFWALAMLAPVRAEAEEWSGTQVVTAVSVERPITAALGVQAFVSRFSVPSTGEGLTFVYAGPTLTFTRGGFQVWAAAQVVGGFGYWDHDGFGPSLWLRLSRGEASLFAEFERWEEVDGDRHLWYGLYAADWNAVPWLSLGAQVEHVDANFHGGPHVGLSQGPVILQLQYHLGLTDDDQTNAARVFILASF